MKMKSLITLALLFTLGFSMVHEYAFASHEDEHYTSISYEEEINHLSNHEDTCEIHFEYHQSYLLSQNNTFSNLESSSLEINLDKEIYIAFTPLTFLKPPIV